MMMDTVVPEGKVWIAYIYVRYLCIVFRSSSGGVGGEILYVCRHGMQCLPSLGGISRFSVLFSRILTSFALSQNLTCYILFPHIPISFNQKSGRGSYQAAATGNIPVAPRFLRGFNTYTLLEEIHSCIYYSLSWNLCYIRSFSPLNFFFSFFQVWELRFPSLLNR